MTIPGPDLIHEPKLHEDSNNNPNESSVHSNDSYSDEQSHTPSEESIQQKVDEITS